MTSREVYPNAPVVLVALELRHPAAEPLSRAAETKAKQLLSRVTPLARRAATLNVGAGPVPVPPEVETAPKFVSRDSTTAVTFQREALVVETTRYVRYERLRDIAATAIEARMAIEPVDGIDRVGLRYINEIRVPEAGSAPADWEPWVHPSLLGPASVGVELGVPAVQYQALMLFDNGPGRAIVARYGPREGYAVDPGGDLKRSTPPPGPYFLLDIDSFWTAQGETPEFEAQMLLSLCDELHAPVRDLFENLITPRLREKVLRGAQ